MAQADNVDQDAISDRPKWSSNVDSFMACLSFSVGLGNIWRFPFTAFENGGGVFLIPYIVVLLFICQPIYFLEMARGQFASHGTAKIWSMCPAFQGVGYGQSWGTFCETTYYAFLIALTFFYTFNTFHPVLPWSVCKKEWGDGCIASNLTGSDGDNLQSSTELYFMREVTKEYDDINGGIGNPNWYLALALFVAWALAFIITSRGPKSIGKVAYFTAIFPYVVLLTLLVRACTLEGSAKGIEFLFKPQWEKLLDVQVWKSAVNQCFFSMSIGLGPIVMGSAYNNFNHILFRDAWIVALIDIITSLTAGVATFATLGNLAHNLKIDDIQKVVKSGLGLAFISYPEAVTNLPVPHLFAMLFFLMMLVLGMSTMVGFMGSINLLFMDLHPKIPYWSVSLVVSIFGMLGGMVYTTPGGVFIIELIDFYGGTYLVFCLTIFEIIGVAWIFGIQNFCDDIYFMTGRKVGFYWRFCWVLITPLMMLFIFIYSLTHFRWVRYSKKILPPLAQTAGWCIFLIGFIQFPGWFIYYCVTHRKETCRESIKNSFRPNEEYGPIDEKFRAEWILYRQQVKQDRIKKNGGKPLNARQHFMQTFSSK